MPTPVMLVVDVVMAVAVAVNVALASLVVLVAVAYVVLLTDGGMTLAVAMPWTRDKRWRDYF